jgi:magnesium-transporting ATPase (P-type)
LLLAVGTLVNDASVHVLGPEQIELHGDPTETALLVAALKAGLEPAALARTWPRRGVIPLIPPVASWRPAT